MAEEVNSNNDINENNITGNIVDNNNIKNKENEGLDNNKKTNKTINSTEVSNLKPYTQIENENKESNKMDTSTESKNTDLRYDVNNSILNDSIIDSKSKVKFKVENSQTGGLDIKIESGRDVTDQIKKFYLRIEEADTIINSIYMDYKKREKYNEKLQKIARVGLEGNNSNPELATISLNELEKEIYLDQGNKIKNRYIKKLGIYAVIISLLMLGGYFLSIAYKKELEMYFIVIIGSMAGTWFSFVVRKIDFNFSDLYTLEKNMMNPALKLAFMGLTAIILVLFLKTGILDITVGDTKLKSATESIQKSLLIGLVSGMFENKMAKEIQARSKSVFGEIDGK